MKTLNLELYKNFQSYFNLLDIIIKNKSSNIDCFLDTLGISPSSYRRSKNDGNKIGGHILSKLCDYFNYKEVNNEIIDDINNKLNNIYSSIYYKTYDNYYEQLSWVNYMLEQQYIIFPLFKLIKLFMLLNNPNNDTPVIENNKELYTDIHLYKSFYINSLNIITEYIDVYFKEKFDCYFLSQEFESPITYQELAIKSANNNNYIESIYFCDKAKQSFILDENYNRIISINLLLMSNYNNLYQFTQSLELSNKQLLSLKQNPEKEIELKKTELLNTIALLGLKKYNEIIKKLENKNKLSLNEIVILLISLFYTSTKKYENLYFKLSKQQNKEINETINIINDILVYANKNKINELLKYKIKNPIILILNKL